MKLPTPLLGALAAALLLPACEEPEPEPTYDEKLRSAFLKALWERDDDEPAPQHEDDINAVDSHGRTQLACYSERLEKAEEDLREAIACEDEESIAEYRKEVAENKEGIREQLRAGADPWARSLSRRDGKLSPCAIQYWSPDFMNELRQEGFIIPNAETPEPPAP